MEGITKIVRRDITNPILRTTDNSNFKSEDPYQIHQLFTAIMEGGEWPELSNIRWKLVKIAGTVFDWMEAVVTNDKRIAAMSVKFLGYGVCMHNNLRAVVILANT